MPAISDDDTGRISDTELNASEQSAKRNMNPRMTSSKESSIRNQNRSNMMPLRRSGKKKKQKKNTTQQDDSAVLQAINKRLHEKSTILSRKVEKR